MVKEALQHVPVFGYALQMFRFIRVRRNNSQYQSVSAQRDISLIQAPSDLQTIAASVNFNAAANLQSPMIALFPGNTSQSVYACVSMSVSEEV